MDSNNCFIDFQSGSGGTEAQDWANMLLRMYIRYAERKNFKVEVMELSEGEVAGIKGATLKVLGEYAFGYFRTETGIHVRAPIVITGAVSPIALAIPIITPWDVR